MWNRKYFNLTWHIDKKLDKCNRCLLCSFLIFLGFHIFCICFYQNLFIFSGLNSQCAKTTWNDYLKRCRFSNMSAPGKIQRSHWKRAFDFWSKRILIGSKILSFDFAFLLMMLLVFVIIAPILARNLGLHENHLKFLPLDKLFSHQWLQISRLRE